jgi:hypothetical protein
MAEQRFSLARLEELSYGRRYEEAAAEIYKLLAYLDAHFGALGDIGKMPSGDLSADLRDAHFASRIAAALTSLFSDPGFQLSESGFRQLIPLQRWLAILFGASPFGSADHIIQLFNQEGIGRREKVTLKQREFLRFCLLYCTDSLIPLDPESLWQTDKRLAAKLFFALLSARIVVTEQAAAKKERLLEWLPPRLQELPFDDFPLDTLQAWISCSYAASPGKHAIKRAINELIRAKLVSLGYGDVDSATLPKRRKPIALCVLEWFHSNHSIYRTHSLSMEALKAKYRLTGVSLKGTVDEASRRVFDEVHVIKDDGVFESVRRVHELAVRLQPDFVYYPSVGMFLETILLVNLRLAPVQVIALGHPATTHSPFIDYVLVEEDYVGDPGCFSERLVALPREAIPYRPPADCPILAPKIRKSPDPVRVAVAATSMKLNPAFLKALRRVVEQSKTRVQFHFFSGMAVGLSKVYLQNVIRQALPDCAVVYPHLPYARYLEEVNGCDMFLNPFPFGNTNGIVDTVRLGLAGVCLTGPEVHSHIDEGLFRRLGLPDWLIARTVDEYVAAAVRLAEKSSEREMLSRQLLKTDPDAVLFRGKPELFLEAVASLQQNAGQGAQLRLPLAARTVPS